MAEQQPVDRNAQARAEPMRTPVENPPPEKPVRSQEEMVERTGRAPEVTGETETDPKTEGR